MLKQVTAMDVAVACSVLSWRIVLPCSYQQLSVLMVGRVIPSNNTTRII